MVIGQQFGLIQLLVGFQNAVFDHLKRASSAFAGPQIFEHELVIGFPVIVEGRIVREGRHQRVRNQLILQRILADSFDEGRQPFFWFAIAAIDVDQVCDRCGDGLCRQLDRHLSDFRGAVHLPA